MDHQRTSVLQEAWHPLHSAYMYAISCSEGRVHLIDAKANRCVQSWSEDELHGHAEESEPAQEDDTISDDDWNPDVLWAGPKTDADLP